MAKETFYFSHDYNARTDHKIKKLIREHGFEGYGIYWALVEDLYDNANALPTDYDTIAYDYRTESDIIISIINNFDLFVVKGNEFGSLSIQERLDARKQKSIKARESANKRWNKSDRNANALPPQSDPNAIKESKVKESKIKESKTEGDKSPAFSFKKSLIDYGFEKQLVEDFLKNRKTKKLSNTKTAHDNFITEIEKTGREKNELFRLIVSKGWGGFKSSWNYDEKQQNNSPHHKLAQNGDYGSL